MRIDCGTFESDYERSIKNLEFPIGAQDSNDTVEYIYPSKLVSEVWKGSDLSVDYVHVVVQVPLEGYSTTASRRRKASTTPSETVAKRRRFYEGAFPVTSSL